MVTCVNECGTIKERGDPMLVASKPPLTPVLNVPGANAAMQFKTLPLTTHAPHTVVRQRRIAAMYTAAVARLDATDRTDIRGHARACRWCDVLYRALTEADRIVGQDGPPLSPDRAWFRHDRQVPA